MDFAIKYYIFRRCMYLQKQTQGFNIVFKEQELEKKRYVYFVQYLTHVVFIRWRVQFYFGINKYSDLFMKE